MGRGGTVNLMELLVAFKGWRLDSLMAEGFLEAFSAQDYWYQADVARHKKRATPSGWPFLFATCCLVGRRESNPRPSAIHLQIYMLSQIY